MSRVYNVYPTGMSFIALATTAAFYMMMRAVEVWGRGSQARIHLALVRVLAGLTVIAGILVLVAVVLDIANLMPAVRAMQEFFAPLE